MKIPDCMKTPWVNELHEAADAYAEDRSQDNLARCRLVLLNGIMNNELLPVSADDSLNFNAMEDKSGKWLFSMFAPIENFPQWYGMRLQECIWFMLEEKMVGLVIDPLGAYIHFPLEDIVDMIDVLHRKSWDEEDDEDDVNDDDTDEGWWDFEDEED